MKTISPKKKKELDRYIIQRAIEIDLFVEAVQLVKPQNIVLGHDGRGTYSMDKETGKKSYLWEEKSHNWKSDILTQEEALEYIRKKYGNGQNGQ